MVSWLARAAGDVVRNTSLSYADVADLTDEQILILMASASREARYLEGTPPPAQRPRVEGFRDEGELKAHYLGLGLSLGLTLDQAEAEFQACKERGAKFTPAKR